MTVSETAHVVDPYREMNERALAAARAMAPAEFIKVMRKIGICDEAGNLTPEYGGPSAKKNGSAKSQ